MNANAASMVAKATAERVASALAADAAVLVLGGDCTVELGTVAGALRETQSVGVVYIDLDTDLNTPESTQDGALDWMGVAHMLGVEGTLPELVALGPRVPMLRPEQVLFFANDNVEPFERQVIEELGIAEVRLAEVAADPSGAAEAVASGWARQFERLLVHLDVDVLDFVDMPLAENNRRNCRPPVRSTHGSVAPLAARAELDGAHGLRAEPRPRGKSTARPCGPLLRPWPMLLLRHPDGRKAGPGSARARPSTHSRSGVADSSRRMTEENRPRCRVRGYNPGNSKGARMFRADRPRFVRLAAGALSLLAVAGCRSRPPGAVAVRLVDLYKTEAVENPVAAQPAGARTEWRFDAPASPAPSAGAPAPAASPVPFAATRGWKRDRRRLARGPRGPARRPQHDRHARDPRRSHAGTEGRGPAARGRGPDARVGGRAPGDDVSVLREGGLPGAARRVEGVRLERGHADRGRQRNEDVRPAHHRVLLAPSSLSATCCSGPPTRRARRSRSSRCASSRAASISPSVALGPRLAGARARSTARRWSRALAGDAALRRRRCRRGRGSTSAWVRSRTAR